MTQKIFEGLDPKSIAVIGASAHPEKVGYQILANLVNGGYVGKIFPVNPKGGKILDLVVYSALGEIPEPIDLAILVIPQKFVVDSVKACVASKIKKVIIISAGFSEIGEDGQKLEEEITSLCLENDIAMIGPNSLGVIDTSITMNASFAKGMPKPGAVSMLSQSGAIISSMISMSHDLSIGFNKIFSLGNKAVLSEVELLDYLYRDDGTKVIIGYIESLKVTPELTETLIRNAKKKPTIILFGGKSAFGAKAAKSHTGSVVSSYLSIKTYLEQAGVVLADDLEDLLSKARIFSSYTHIAGDRVAIITNAGGPAIAASDAVSAAGLSLPKLAGQTIELLRQKIRPEAALSNPVDILGDATDEDYRTTLEIVSTDEEIDAILLLLTPQTSTKIIETAEVVAEYSGTVPVISSFVGGEILTKAKELIESSGKPCYSYPEEAVLGLRALVSFVEKKQTIAIPEKPSKVYENIDRDKILKEFNLPIIQYARVEDASVAVTEAEQIGYPVVVKTANTDSHKSDNGGVVVNIQNGGELTAAIEKIGLPVVIGPMVKGKFEILLGVKKDENIGTTILFGTGGIYSEIYADFSYLIAPITHEMAREMILSTKMGLILDGARGQKKYDLDKLAQIVVDTVRFVDNYVNISEVDFNPIIADESGFHMVDVRIILTQMDD